MDWTRNGRSRWPWSPAAIYRHFPDCDALVGEVAGMARLDLARRMLDKVERVDEANLRKRLIRRFQAIGRGYIQFAQEEPHLLASAFLPIEPPSAMAADPNPWQVLAAALDELVATGAMPVERRAGAETIAWSSVDGFAILRAGFAFDVSGETDPDPETVLDAIARSLDVQWSG